MKKAIPTVAVAIAIITGVILLMSFTVPDLTGRTASVEKTDIAESPIKASDAEGIIPGGYIHAKATRIVDGDTIEVEYKNEEYKVRLLCIDTPETVKSGLSVQPYGMKATEKMRSLVLNKKVTLIFEKDVYDNYERLLAYIMLKNGTVANAVLVEQGLARVNIVRPNNVHKDYFNKLQEKAIKEKKGLWSLPVEKRPFVKNEKGYYVPQYIKDDAA